MSSFVINPIDDYIVAYRARSVLLVTQILERYKEEWNKERGETETLLKLRNREDAFAARAAMKGLRVTPMRHSEVTAKKVRTDGPFDLVIVAGEVTYQSFSIAARVRKVLPGVPTLVEFCETMYDDLAHRLIIKNARHHGCENLMGRLVYLTSVPKHPREFVIGDEKEPNQATQRRRG